MTQEWVKDWQVEDANITPVMIRWMRSRPYNIKEVMLKFPVECLVRATRDLVCPAPGTVGFLAGYNENGTMIIVQHPDQDLSARCDPDWLEVVGYRKGLTPNDVRSILEGDD